MSRFGDDFPEYRNPVIAMTVAVLPPVIRRSADDIAEAEEAYRARIERNELCGLTVGQIRDHLQHMVELATSVEGHNFESLPQIADAILMLQADLGEQLDEAHP